MMLSAAAAYAADKVIGGPMVVNVTGRSAQVVWVVQSDEVVLTQQGADPKSAPVLHSETVTFNGLKPGTSYDYAVPGHAELKGTFKTAPAAGQNFEFVAYGDTRTRPDAHRSVIQAMLKYSHPDFVIQSGDLVENGNDTALWPIFFDIEHDLLNKVAFYPALGNHERNARAYFDFTQVPQYYSFTWGNAHFAVLDTDIASMAANEPARQAAWKEQVQWLEDDLKKNQNTEFRFVSGHHPPVTAVASRQGNNPHITALMPMFEQLHVNATLWGHDHNYQHYLKNGIHYVVSGGGGAPLYDVEKPPQDILVKAVSIENFVRIRMEGKVAHVTAIAPDGKELDKFDIEGGKK
jgi:hypothetical protein